MDLWDKIITRRNQTICPTPHCVILNTDCEAREKFELNCKYTCNIKYPYLVRQDLYTWKPELRFPACFKSYNAVSKVEQHLTVEVKMFCVLDVDLWCVTPRMQVACLCMPRMQVAASDEKPADAMNSCKLLSFSIFLSRFKFIAILCALRELKFFVPSDAPDRKSDTQRCARLHDTVI